MGTLQVLICTYGSRLAQIDTAAMPAVEGVGYLICCQNPEGLDLGADAARLASRHDIEVRFFADRGLSGNRNHAFDAATADYLLVSDDDISYSADGLRALAEAFDTDPTLDIATTRAIIPEEHIYPPGRHKLGERFRGYSPISFEIALRRSAVEAKRLRFSTLAGIGAPYLHSGEEDFFVRAALRAGLRGEYTGIVVSTHSGPTTCTRSGAAPGVVRAKGAFLTADRGIAGAAIRFPIEAMRSPAPFRKALLYLVQGAVYYLTHRRSL